MRLINENNHHWVFRGRLGESKGAELAKVLMETKVWVLSDEQCNQITKKLIKFNPKSMICAHEKNTDACQVRIECFH